jgi:hypothetical protein
MINTNTRLPKSCMASRSKLETLNKFKTLIFNAQNRILSQELIEGFVLWSLDIVSRLVLRISKFK